MEPSVIPTDISADIDSPDHAVKTYSVRPAGNLTNYIMPVIVEDNSTDQMMPISIASPSSEQFIPSTAVGISANHIMPVSEINATTNHVMPATEMNGTNSHIMPVREKSEINNYNIMPTTEVKTSVEYKMPTADMNTTNNRVMSVTEPDHSTTQVMSMYAVDPVTNRVLPIYAMNPSNSQIIPVSAMDMTTNHTGSGSVVNRPITQTMSTISAHDVGDQALNTIDESVIDNKLTSGNTSDGNFNLHSNDILVSDSRNDGRVSDPGVSSDPNVVSKWEIKQAWSDNFPKQYGLDSDAEEERIKELLAYMEEEKVKQEIENRRIKGAPLEDIQEDEEDFLKLSVDSRPNTQQATHRPTSSRSRPRSSRSRPVSGRSRASGGDESLNGPFGGNDEIDPNTARNDNWYMPVRPPSVMDKNQAPGVTLESSGKYRISLPSDTEKCLVSGMTFLDSGDLVLCDKGNQKVKFVDSKFQFISQLPISEPWDLCSVENEIYVTMGSTSIQHLFVKDMVLELGKTFEMSESCHGIANFNNGIAVGLKTSEIHLMNTQGEVKRIIKIPKTEKGRQMCPWHLSVTEKFDILVTDPSLRTVCCLSSKGELLFRYPDMSNPRATISDSSGNIVLVGLNKDTNLVMQILRKAGDSVICVKSVIHLDDMEFEPNAISLRKSDGLLVLGGMRHALKRYKIV